MLHRIFQVSKEPLIKLMWLFSGVSMARPRQLAKGRLGGQTDRQGRRSSGQYLVWRQRTTRRGVSELPPSLSSGPHKGQGPDTWVAPKRRRRQREGAGLHLHRQRAATNRDGRSGSPRAFWGRIDRRAALWGAGPAASGGGTTAGAARRTSRLAGAASLPAAAVSSARLSDRACGRSGGLLGGLGGARGGETRSEGRRGAAAAAAATGLLTKDNDY